MPTDAIITEAINVEELKAALAEAPVLTTRFVKTSLFRFARRVSRRVKTDYLKGSPGIKGGPWARLKDKNIFGFTTGTDLATLKAVNKASRIVRTHIEGATITAKAGGWLFLSRKRGKAGAGTIFARVRSVTIPARVPFEAVWQREIPGVTVAVANDLERAMRTAMEQRMRLISAAVSRLTHV